MSDLVTRPDVFVGGRWLPSLDGTDTGRGRPVHRRRVRLRGARRRRPTSTPPSRPRGTASTTACGPTGQPPSAPPCCAAAADHLEQLGADAVDLLTRELGCPRWFSERAHVPNPIRHLRYYADLIEREPAEEIRARRRQPQPGDPRAGRRGRRDHPVERPAQLARHQDRPGAGRRLLGGPEAAAGDAAHRLPARRRVRGGRPARGRAERRCPAAATSARTWSGIRRWTRSPSPAAPRPAGRSWPTAPPRIARVTLELGGKSAAIVLDDADIAHVVAAVIPMAFTVNGQLCMAQSRILVPRRRQAEFADALTAAFAALPVGDPFAPETQIGPLVSERQRERVEGYLALAGEEGARVLGGGRPRGLEHGYYVNPALLADVDNRMRVAQEEIFGPVMAMIPYDAEDEAVRDRQRLDLRPVRLGMDGRPRPRRSRSRGGSAPAWSASTAHRRPGAPRSAVTSSPASAARWDPRACGLPGAQVGSARPGVSAPLPVPTSLSRTRPGRDHHDVVR